jgi:hypothetical protein
MPQDTFQASQTKDKLLYLLAKNKSARDESNNFVENTLSPLFGRFFVNNYHDQANITYLNFLFVMSEKLQENIKNLVDFYADGNRLEIPLSDNQALARLEGFSKRSLETVAWYPKAYKAVASCETLPEFLNKLMQLRVDLLQRFSIKQLQQAAQDINLLQNSQNKVIKEIYYPIFKLEYEMIAEDIFCWFDALIALTTAFIKEKDKSRSTNDIRRELARSIDKGSFMVSPYIDQSLVDNDMTKVTLHTGLFMIVSLSNQYEKLAKFPRAAQAA